MRTCGTQTARRGFLRAAGAAVGVAAVGPLLGTTGAIAALAGNTTTLDPDDLFQAGWFAAADAGYARLLRRYPRNAHGWAQRGYIALLGNRFAQAQRYLSAAIGLNPADQLSAARLADCFVRQDDFARAIPLLHQAGDHIGAALYSAVTGAPYQVHGRGSTTLPFRTLDPLPTVPVGINGREATFVLGWRTRPGVHRHRGRAAPRRH